MQPAFQPARDFVLFIKTAGRLGYVSRIRASKDVPKAVLSERSLATCTHSLAAGLPVIRERRHASSALAWLGHAGPGLGGGRSGVCRDSAPAPLGSGATAAGGPGAGRGNRESNGELRWKSGEVSFAF